MALGVLTIGGFAAAPPTSATQPTPVPTLDWADCSDGFQCATAEVPLDYPKPRKDTIDIDLVRRPAADPEHRIGTIFLGHPLGTIDLIHQLPPPVFDILGNFDVVAYNGRGTGPTSIDCGIDEELLQPFTSNATRPGAEDFDAMVAAADEYGRRCLDAHGDLLSHMSTATMARDLDLLRAAVGDEKLTYIGTSQGTDLGATYATMFPARTRAMVFDAAVDAATWRDRPLEAWREQDVSYENEFDRFFTACATHQEACGFGGDDPETAFDTLLARLDRTPIPSSDSGHPGPADGDDVRLAARDSMLDPRRWPRLAAALVQAESGDGTIIQQIVDDAIENPVSPEFDAFVANVAVSQRYPRNLDAVVHETAHRYGLLDHLWASGQHVSLVAHRWPVRSGDTFRGDYENPTTSPTILVIGGTHDPATPYQWAERLTHDLGNARLMTYQSDGHGALNDLDPCLVVPVVTYLINPAALPPEGHTCGQLFEPFAG